MTLSVEQALHAIIDEAVILRYLSDSASGKAERTVEAFDMPIGTYRESGLKVLNQ